MYMDYPKLLYSPCKIRKWLTCVCGLVGVTTQDANLAPRATASTDHRADKRPLRLQQPYPTNPTQRGLPNAFPLGCFRIVNTGNSI